MRFCYLKLFFHFFNSLFIFSKTKGKRIYSAVFQNLIFIMDWVYNSTAAVSSPRFYHPLTPNALEMEMSYDVNLPNIVAGLKACGHKMSWRGLASSLVNTVQMRDNDFDSAADPRLDLVVVGQ